MLQELDVTSIQWPVASKSESTQMENLGSAAVCMFLSLKELSGCPALI